MSNQAVRSLNIISIGASIGSTQISNQELVSAGFKINEPYLSESHSRASELYFGQVPLKEWLEWSAEKKLLFAKEKTTELGVNAVKDALSKAGIDASSLGLLVGDSSTAIEVTPSEGQRIAGSLGLKIPSYDITACAGAFVVHIDSIRRWKAERVPDYACFVSSNLATHLLSVDMPVTARFGDGASAMIVSNKHTGSKEQGSFIVEDSFVLNQSSVVNSARIGKFGEININEALLQEFILQGTRQSLDRLKLTYGTDVFKDSYFIGSALYPEITKQLAGESGFDGSNCLGIEDNYGYILGGSTAATLYKLKNKIEPKKKIFVVQSGIGFFSGAVVLQST